MKITWLDTHEGITLLAEDGYVRVANPVELELRRAGIHVAAFVSWLMGETSPPESVMDALEVFTDGGEADGHARAVEALQRIATDAEALAAKGEQISTTWVAAGVREALEMLGVHPNG